ncbi:MAG: glycoside hydrolase family 88 protein [Bryobacterales bacterium]|nr:glycoside hydrolase family 88 protein [Bryobacterales bacterium]
MSHRELFESTIEFSESQVRRLVERHPGFYPLYTNQGRWRHDLPVWTHWCDGFLPGLMWIFQARHAPGSPLAGWWLDQAIRYTQPLEPRKQDREIHDLGFIFLPTYYRWWKLTGDPSLRDVLIEAGRTMSLRFREKGRYLRSFVAEDSLFIDIMMNVGIIFFAARETGDPRLHQIALQHCLTTRRVLLRGDGSTAHEGIFDLATGEFLRQSTHQGFRSDSCWSRGLAWSLYGFGCAYEHTQDVRFLRTAESCADYYLAHTPAGGVPPWDYDAPEESRKLPDTSAAAIAAGGLLRLSGLSGDPDRAQTYRSFALNALATLCERHVARADSGWEGILKNGVYHLHYGLGVDESVMWGEYFFLEALESALRI